MNLRIQNIPKLIFRFFFFKKGLYCFFVQLIQAFVRFQIINPTPRFSTIKFENNIDLNSEEELNTQSDTQANSLEINVHEEGLTSTKSESNIQEEGLTATNPESKGKIITLVKKVSSIFKSNK